MKTIELYPLVSSFAENKDVAQQIRKTLLVPALESREEIILDFQNIDAVTQSFILALISELFRMYGGEVLDFIIFKHCNKNVKNIINMVIEYMQESQ